jgi:hypothetical protein
MSTTANFDIYRAEDVLFTFTQLDTDGVTPKNITGWTIAFRVASTQFSAAVITKTPTLTFPISGIFTVALASGDTSGLTQDGLDTTYYYDVRRTDSGSRTELFQGTLLIRDTNTNG